MINHSSTVIYKSIYTMEDNTINSAFSIALENAFLGISHYLPSTIIDLQKSIYDWTISSSATTWALSALAPDSVRDNVKAGQSAFKYWDTQIYALNNLVGYDAGYFGCGLTKDDINTLIQTCTLVTQLNVTKKLYSIISIVGITDDKKLIINDPLGNYTDSYITQNGKEIKVDFDTLWTLTDNGGGMHNFVIFDPENAVLSDSFSFENEDKWPNISQSEYESSLTTKLASSKEIANNSTELCKQYCSGGADTTATTNYANDCSDNYIANDLAKSYMDLISNFITEKLYPENIDVSATTT